MMTNAEIQVGEYVRTKKHGIFKVAEIHKTEYGYYVLRTDTFEVFTIGKGFSHEIKNDIVSHSFNVIDLIEVGDYVNGNKVVDVGGAWKDNLETITIIEVENIGEIVNSADIKTIVTKEQFRTMEYKVGGEDE